MTQEANEAIALAVRNLSRHRLHLMMVVARAGSERGLAVTGGVELDARLSAKLVVTLCVPDSLNERASGIMVVRGDRIERAGGRRADGGLVEVDEVDAIAERARSVVIAVSERDGGVWMGAPGLPRRRVDPQEVAVLLRDLRGV